MRDINGSWPTSALVVFVGCAFVAGCWSGQEYLRYQVRSAFAGAFGGAASATGSGERGVADASPAEWPEVDLSNWTWSQDDGRCVVVGEVKNLSDTALPRPKVTATIYNAAGKVVANNDSYVDISTLAPGATAPFDVRVLDCYGPTDKAALTLTYGFEDRPTRQKG